MRQRCVIIGASHAGAELAVGLRQQGWDGEVLVIGEESTLPYQRPPLSKEFVLENMTALDLLIRPPETYSSHGIEFLLETRAVTIDRKRRTVTTRNAKTGEAEVAYDKLALCTGSRVRRLDMPGAELAGIYYMRTLDDAEAIKGVAQCGRRAVIVGGGYIGLECAAMLRKKGLQVTVLEAAPRVLARVTATEVADFYQRVHTEEGVAIRTDVAITAFTGDDWVRSVKLAGGEELPADFVIVGIGVIPNTELAENAGLAIENGIVVNEFAQTADPHIVAAGDCTNHPTPWYGNVRLESLPNAMEQAKCAAATLCGKQQPHHSLPWFWSDQYDMKLQIAGLSHDYDQVVLRGDSHTGRSFAAFYLKENQLVAADCVNRPKEFMLARRCIAQQIPVEAGKLADESVDLKSLVRK